jgi:hypothetical protein
MCVGCMAMAAAAFAGVNAQSPAPAPVIIVQKPTSADLVRAAFKENRIERSNPHPAFC